jgi:hypothetical protein
VLKHKALFSFFLSTGIIVILLFSMMLIAPVSGAYLTLKATTAPNTLAIASSEEKEKRIAVTATSVPTSLPTRAVEPEKTQLPPPIIVIPATMIEIELTGVGLHDNIHNSFEVTGEACVRNSGANLTSGLSPLRLQVLASSDSQNFAPISDETLELVFEQALAPDSKQCFRFCQRRD